MKKIPRIYFPWWKWECYKSGFFDTVPPNGYDDLTAKVAYKEFLSDIPLFEYAMSCVAKEWYHSSLQNLTNPSMNRIAWLGQSAMCISSGIPAIFRSGFTLLTHDQQSTANKAAENFLENWIEENFEHCTSLQREMARTRIPK